MLLMDQLTIYFSNTKRYKNRLSLEIKIQQNERQNNFNYGSGRIFGFSFG